MAFSWNSREFPYREGFNLYRNGLVTSRYHVTTSTLVTRHVTTPRNAIISVTYAMDLTMDAEDAELVVETAAAPAATTVDQVNVPDLDTLDYELMS